jgi:hypothetical protein
MRLDVDVAIVVHGPYHQGGSRELHEHGQSGTSLTTPSPKLTKAPDFRHTSLNPHSQYRRRSDPREYPIAQTVAPEQEGSG